METIATIYNKLYICLKLSNIVIDITLFNFAGSELSRQLDHWLDEAELLHGPARAIIAP